MSACAWIDFSFQSEATENLNISECIQELIWMIMDFGGGFVFPFFCSLDYKEGETADFWLQGWWRTHRLQVIHADGQLPQRQEQVELRAQKWDVAHLEESECQPDEGATISPSPS